MDDKARARNAIKLGFVMYALIGAMAFESGPTSYFAYILWLVLGLVSSMFLSFSFLYGPSSALHSNEDMFGNEPDMYAAPAFIIAMLGYGLCFWLSRF